MSTATTLYEYTRAHYPDKHVEWRNGYHACLTAYRWPPFQGNREYREGWAAAWQGVWDAMRERGADWRTRRNWLRYRTWAAKQGLGS